MKRIMAVALVLVLALSMAVTASAADLGVGTVHGGWLRMRSAPTTLSAVIGRYYTGTKVTVHSAIGSWYYVTAPDGVTGYMSRNYVTLNAGGAGTPGSGWSGTPSGETGYVTSQNGRGVRLRSSPSTATSANIIGLYSVGTKLTVLQHGTGWHYIQIGGQVGYMMSQFIIISGGPAPIDPEPIVPDVHYTAYVTSQNGKGVRLRSGPGVNYSMLGTYPVGTQVTVLKNLGAWSYISIAGKKGYMMSVFLTTVAPWGPTPPPWGPTPPPVTPTATPVPGPGGVLQDAQITIQNPIIGDRMYVYVTPSGAQYSVRWYNELNVQVGASNGYTVQESDRGHRLRAVVSGQNGWSGSITTVFTDIIGGTAPVPQTLTGSVSIPGTAKVNDTLIPIVKDCNASALVFTWYVDGLKHSQQNSLKVTAEMAGKTVQVVVTAAGYQNSLTAVTQVQAATPSTTPTPSVVELITPPPAVSFTPAPPVTPVVEPVTPVVEPVTPVVEPVTPVVEPVTPVVEPVTPVVEPVTPVVEPVTPVVEPVTPVVEPITPVVEPVTPVVEPITPAVEPVTPVVEPITPAVEPVTPAVEPITPAVEPVTPVVEPISPGVEPVAPSVEATSSSEAELIVP